MVGEDKQRVSIDADSENSVNNETTRTTTNYVVAKCAIQIWHKITKLLKKQNYEIIKIMKLKV